MTWHDRAQNWLDMEAAQAPYYIPPKEELEGKGRVVDRLPKQSYGLHWNQIPLPSVVQEQYEARKPPAEIYHSTQNQAYRDYMSYNQAGPGPGPGTGIGYEEVYTEIMKPPSSGFGSHKGQWDEGEIEALWGRGDPNHETQPGDTLTREDIDDSIQQYLELGWLKPEYQEALLNMPIWRDEGYNTAYMGAHGWGLKYNPKTEWDNPVSRIGGIVGHEFTHYIDVILGHNRWGDRPISHSQEWQDALDTLAAEGRYDLHDLGARLKEDGTIIPEDVGHLWTYYAEQAPWAIPYELRQFFPQFTEESFELPEGYRQVRQDGRLRIADEQGYAPERWTVHGVRGGGALYSKNDPGDYT